MINLLLNINYSSAVINNYVLYATDGTEQSLIHVYCNVGINDEENYQYENYRLRDKRMIFREESARAA